MIVDNPNDFCVFPKDYLGSFYSFFSRAIAAYEFGATEEEAKWLVEESKKCRNKLECFSSFSKFSTLKIVQKTKEELVGDANSRR